VRRAPLVVLPLLMLRSGPFAAVFGSGPRRFAAPRHAPPRGGKGTAAGATGAGRAETRRPRRSQPPPSRPRHPSPTHRRRDGKGAPSRWGSARVAVQLGTSCGPSPPHHPPAQPMAARALQTPVRARTGARAASNSSCGYCRVVRSHPRRRAQNACWSAFIDPSATMAGIVPPPDRAPQGSGPPRARRARGSTPRRRPDRPPSCPPEATAPPQHGPAGGDSRGCPTASTSGLGRIPVVGTVQAQLPQAGVAHRVTWPPGRGRSPRGRAPRSPGAPPPGRRPP
jgi:hypothetical protein